MPSHVTTSPRLHCREAALVAMDRQYYINSEEICRLIEGTTFSTCPTQDITTSRAHSKDTVKTVLR
jgi:hypothetical protein